MSSLVTDAEPQSWVDLIREELGQVREHLLNPTSEGLTGSLPHLEQAVRLFQQQLPAFPERPTPLEMEQLRRELALASMLFENAYRLQAGWATMQGFAFDGVPADALYGQSGEWVSMASSTMTEVCQG